MATIAARIGQLLAGDISLQRGRQPRSPSASVSAFTVNVIGLTAGLTPTAVAASALSGLVTHSGSAGGIALISTAGGIALSNAVTAGAGGNVLLQAAGAFTSLQGNATVQSGSGNITLLGAQNVAFAATDNVQTGGGTIDIESGAGFDHFQPRGPGQHRPGRRHRRRHPHAGARPISRWAG